MSDRIRQKNKRGDSKVESNDSPKFPDRGVCGGGGRGRDIRHIRPPIGEYSFRPDPHSDSVVRSDQSPRETSGADQSNNVKTDFIAPLHWFSAATDQIARLSQNMDRGLKVQALSHDSVRSDQMLWEPTD